MHWAAQYGRKETVIALLDLGAKVNRRSATEKLTALMLASREGYKSIVSILLSRGADANILDAFGWTALHFACSWGRRDTAQILIVEGLAHINSREYGAGTGGEAGTYPSVAGFVMLLTVMLQAQPKPRKMTATEEAVLAVLLRWLWPAREVTSRWSR